MDVHAEAARIVAALDLKSGGRLRRREDLLDLLVLGLPEARRPVFDDLAFSAKFLARARGMLERIGHGGQGYDRIAAEFAEHLGRASALLRSLLDGAPEPVRSRLQAVYLGMEPETLESLLALCHDLGWYKNWLIDGGGSPPGS
jgi:hypothetical protein